MSIVANKPVIKCLDNGLQVVTLSSEFHASMIGVMVGHLHDPEELRGAAHTTEHVMIRGASKIYRHLMAGRKTKPVSEEELLRIMRRYLGGTDGDDMNVFTVHTYTSYGHGDLQTRLDLKKVFFAFASTLREGMYDLRDAGQLGILGDPVLPIERNATFNEAGLGREDLTHRAMLKATQILYEGHVVARSWGDPSEKQISSFTLGKLKEWARQHYVPSNMSVVFSGPKMHEAMEMVKRAELDQLPNWPLTGSQPKAIFPELTGIQRASITCPTTDMTHVVRMWPTDPSARRDRSALMVLASVLKELLEEELREKLSPYPGGVYHPSMEYDASPVYGCLVSWFATLGNTAHARELSERAMNVIRGVQGRVTTALEEAVEDFKCYMISSHKNALNYDAGSLVELVMDHLATGDRELQEFNSYTRDIENVTARDVRRVACKYLHDDRFVQVMLGPQ